MSISIYGKLKKDADYAHTAEEVVPYPEYNPEHTETAYTLNGVPVESIWFGEEAADDGGTCVCFKQVCSFHRERLLDEGIVPVVDTVYGPCFPGSDDEVMHQSLEDNREGWLRVMDLTQFDDIIDYLYVG
jgi:hypothetical protein